MLNKYVFVAAIGAVLAVSGCQRTSYTGSQPTQSMPQPLAPAPVGQVQSNALPPPTGSGTYQPGQIPGGTASMGNNQSQFPEAPSQPGTSGGMGNVAAPSGAQQISSSALVGSWKVNEGGISCDMFLTLTNLGDGLRGGTRGCTGSLSSMKSWGINGDQVVLNDANGYAISRLYKTADNRIEGTNSSGQQVVLSR